MWNYQAAFLLLLLVIMSVPGEGVEFPQLLGKISDCVKVQCSREIKACEELHGEDLTPQLKGCVAKNCRTTMIACMDWIPQVFLAARLSQSTMLTPEFVKNVAETTIEMLVDSYLYCFRSIDLQNSTHLVCVLENMLDRGEPYINLVLGMLDFSDKGFVMCYLRQIVSSYGSCMSDFDEYFSQLEENMQWEMTFNQHEYTTCMAVSFTERKCFPLLSRIYGFTPALQTQSKGLFLCMLNGLVVSAAAC